MNLTTCLTLQTECPLCNYCIYDLQHLLPHRCLHHNNHINNKHNCTTMQNNKVIRQMCRGQMAMPINVSRHHNSKVKILLLLLLLITKITIWLIMIMITKIIEKKTEVSLSLSHVVPCLCLHRHVYTLEVEVDKVTGNMNNNNSSSSKSVRRSCGPCCSPPNVIWRRYEPSVPDAGVR